MRGRVGSGRAGRAAKLKPSSCERRRPVKARLFQAVSRFPSAEHFVAFAESNMHLAAAGASGPSWRPSVEASPSVLHQRIKVEAVSMF